MNKILKPLIILICLIALLSSCQVDSSNSKTTQDPNTTQEVVAIDEEENSSSVQPENSSDNIEQEKTENVDNSTDELKHLQNTSLNESELISEFSKSIGSDHEIITDKIFKTSKLYNDGETNIVPATYKENGSIKLDLYIFDSNGKILEKLSSHYVNNWEFAEIDLVDIFDANSDGFDDIIVIAEYYSGVGAEGAIPYPAGSIYLQEQGSFNNYEYVDSQFTEMLNDIEPAYTILEDIKEIIELIDFNK